MAIDPVPVPPVQPPAVPAPRYDSYATKYWLAVGVTVLLAMLGAVQVASNPLELTQQQQALIGVATAGLGVLNGLLPRVTMSPSDTRAGLD